jgi:hypothetical protein
MVLTFYMYDLYKSVIMNTYMQICPELVKV